MRRLFFMLAWAECQRTTWMRAAGKRAGAAEALAAAFSRLGDMARVPGGMRWRPMVAGAGHGLKVSGRV